MQYSAERILLAPLFECDSQITWQKMSLWEKRNLRVKPRWLPFSASSLHIRHSLVVVMEENIISTTLFCSVYNNGSLLISPFSPRELMGLDSSVSVLSVWIRRFRYSRRQGKAVKQKPVLSEGSFCLGMFPTNPIHSHSLVVCHIT